MVINIVVPISIYWLSSLITTAVPYTIISAALCIIYEVENSEIAFKFEEAKDPSLIVNFETLSKILRSRRSIRRYKPDSVPEEEISKILEATRYAPSAGNAQSWEYIVLTDFNKIDKIRKAAIKMMKLLRILTVLRQILFLLKMMKLPMGVSMTQFGILLS